MSFTKFDCPVCECFVKVEGHEDRCVVADSELKSKMRRLAWLGDVRHTADVRIMLLNMPLEDAELQVIAARYLSRGHQASFYAGYDKHKVPAMSTSERSRSTAFEASYVGDFRRDYLVSLGRVIGEEYVISSTARDFLAEMIAQLV